ncbi:MAG: hypothetical protein L6R40_003258 [Gallowayella cf. fulva]|nr:MAG: hypothetical protein L6R40_003258 [Xanthomendoza cf. fulva]
MPAPLAKGIIVSISLLLAAGLAVYEHPQIKQWVDESRRKIAFALHNLGDDLDPPSSSRRNSSQDASTREDSSAEAAERRRKARQDILERGRKMEERRRAQQASSAKSKSFDDLVDAEGKLKHDTVEATTSATEPHTEQTGLRNRNIEAQGLAAGTAFADPFADEAYAGDLPSATAPILTSSQCSRSSSTATLPASPAPPPVPPKEPLDHVPSDPASQSHQQPRLLIDTDAISNHPSEALVDLTPTTSASSIAADLSELDHQSHPSHHSQSNFWSVHEWAENSSAPAHFYTPPRSEAAVGEENRNRADERSSNGDERSEIGSGERISRAGSGERISRAGSVSDMDVMSQISGVSTPGSWTELGSQVSEDF